MKIMLWLTLMTLLLGARISMADPVVLGYDLVSSVRSGRTAFDYTYRIRLANHSSPYTSSVIQVTSKSAGTVLLDPDVYVGYVPADGEVTPNDTFTMRQDRLQAFSPSVLSWTFQGDAITFTNDPVEFEGVAFVEYAGSPEHAGWLPILGEPLAGSGENATLAVSLNAPVATGRLELIDDRFAILATASLSPMTETEATLTDYLARLPVPTKDFRVRLIATDRSGRSVNKVWPASFRPATVALRFVGNRLSAAPGGALEIPLQVTNLGTSRQFNLSVSSASPSLELVQSSGAVTLGSGESTVVTVTATIGADIPEFATTQVRATVISTGTPVVRNVLTIEIEAASKPSAP